MRERSINIKLKACSFHSSEDKQDTPQKNELLGNQGLRGRYLQ